MCVSVSAHMFCLAILLSSTLSYETAQERSADVVRGRVRHHHRYEHFYQYTYIGLLRNGNITKETEN
jgi:hypothetical protein